MEKKDIEWGGRIDTFVRISSVPGFSEWLKGQTVPVINNDPDPMDWAYLDDYERFIRGAPVID